MFDMDTAGIRRRLNAAQLTHEIMFEEYCDGETVRAVMIQMKAERHPRYAKMKIPDVAHFKRLVPAPADSPTTK